MRHLKVVDENFIPLSTPLTSPIQNKTIPFNMELIKIGLNGKKVIVWSHTLIISTCIEQVLNIDFVSDAQFDLLKLELQTNYPELTLIRVPNEVEDSTHIAINLNSSSVVEDLRDSSIFLSDETTSLLESAMKKFRLFNETLSLVICKKVSISKVF